ncbi:MAG: FAD-dependent oxidoreductase [Armatimonadota bacterium]
MSTQPANPAFDVIVLGGGTAGVTAAIQAGRAGARTLLVEKTGMLGGTVTVGGVSHPAAFFAWGRQIIAGIGWELVERCLAESGSPHPLSPEKIEWTRTHAHIRVDRFLFAALCDEMTVNAGVEILFHTMIAGVAPAPDGWAVTLCTKTGLETRTARVLIDCTGDANAVALAGFPLNVPDEVQPATLCCHAGGYDPEALDIDAINRAFDAAVQAGELDYTDVTWSAVAPNVGHWLRNRGENAGHIRGINAGDSAGKTQAEMAGRRALLRLYRFLRTQPGLENLRFDHIAPECGIRETATIVGKCTVTEADYLSGRVWDDAVCYAFYPLDLHTSTDKGTYSHPLPEGVVPTVPRGALLPAGSRNLLVAGRCLASDRLANSALRVQAPCMAMGQAAGAMAALAAQTGTEVESLPLADIHALLRAHGAIIPVERPCGG